MKCKVEGFGRGSRNMKITMMSPDECPCKSCRFKPDCRWAHEYEVVECKDWGAKEEGEE